jgi:hypothetical protein
MIKVGFICEGYTEKILLESAAFGDLLRSLNIESLQVINSEGCDNLLPHNIGPYTTILENAGAHFIVIVTDLDDDSCITETKKRISARKQDVVIVAVKKIEAWFLACSPAMRKLLGRDEFTFPNPEMEDEPFETINGLLLKHSGRGIGKKTAGKKKLINRLLENGLDLTDAAAHGSCSSAAYFLRKLQEIGASETGAGKA